MVETPWGADHGSDEKPVQFQTTSAIAAASLPRYPDH